MFSLFIGPHVFSRKKAIMFRWTRIRLRTAFVLSGVLCLWLSHVSKQAKDQMLAVGWVESLGGSVGYDAYVSESRLMPTWFRDKLGVDYFDTVRSVEFRYGCLENLSGLEELTRITHLDLCNSRVVALGPMARLQNLQVLKLSNTRVTDVSPLSNLNELVLLKIDGTRVSDISSLARLRNLKILNLRDSQVVDVSPLKNLKALEILVMPANAVGVEILKKELPGCEFW